MVRDETVMSAVWVTDGIERCRVGFLSRRRIGIDDVDGKLGQVIEFISLSWPSSTSTFLLKQRFREGCRYWTRNCRLDSFLIQIVCVEGLDSFIINYTCLFFIVYRSVLLHVINVLDEELVFIHTLEDGHKIIGLVIDFVENG